jgi:hypothetical protein
MTLAFNAVIVLVSIFIVYTPNCDNIIPRVI